MTPFEIEVLEFWINSNRESRLEGPLSGKKEAEEIAIACEEYNKLSESFLGE